MSKILQTIRPGDMHCTIIVAHEIHHSSTVPYRPTCSEFIHRILFHYQCIILVTYIITHPRKVQPFFSISIPCTDSITDFRTLLRRNADYNSQMLLQHLSFFCLRPATALVTSVCILTPHSWHKCTLSP